MLCKAESTAFEKCCIGEYSYQPDLQENLIRGCPQRAKKDCCPPALFLSNAKMIGIGALRFKSPAVYFCGIPVLHWFRP